MKVDQAGYDQQVRGIEDRIGILRHVFLDRDDPTLRDREVATRERAALRVHERATVDHQVMGHGVLTRCRA